MPPAQSSPGTSTPIGREGSRPDVGSGPGKIERYRIEELIGRGGMGEVYRAVDERLRRAVALKMVRPEIQDNHADAVARLFREARAAAALTHPNTVAIHDIGESSGVFYIVMELVRGRPLLAYIGDRSISLPQKLRWLTDIARALSCAHKGGVLHRDVKPSNVMVTEEDVAKVLDFGLAKPVEPQSFDFRTQVGHVVGTARYMAPEQLAGQEVDPRCDQYSFGVTAYELLSGQHPKRTPMGEPPLVDTVAPEVPAEVALVVARTMKPRRQERFTTMDEVVTAFEDLVHGRPVRVSLPARSAESAALTSRPRKPLVKMDATVNDPGLAHGTPTVTDAPPIALESLAAPGTMSLPPTKLPPIFDATVQSSVTPLELRRAAHARAHDAARTLLSRERPTDLRAPFERAPKFVTTAPLTPGHSGPPPARSGIPSALRSGAPSGDVPATATSHGQARPERPPRTRHREKKGSLAIVFVAVVLMTVAAGLGMFIGWKMKTEKPARAPVPSATAEPVPPAAMEEDPPPVRAAPALSVPAKPPRAAPTPTPSTPRPSFGF